MWHSETDMLSAPHLTALHSSSLSTSIHLRRSPFAPYVHNTSHISHRTIVNSLPVPIQPLNPHHDHQLARQSRPRPPPHGRHRLRRQGTILPTLPKYLCTHLIQLPDQRRRNRAPLRRRNDVQRRRELPAQIPQRSQGHQGGCCGPRGPRAEPCASKD
jgi:hypothetical protein